MSINMANAHTQLSEKVLKDAEKFKYPLLLLYGAKDSVQRIDEVKKFYRYVGSK
jgi:alpha-beta hydrolase superfamily lysophospholipase